MIRSSGRRPPTLSSPPGRSSAEPVDTSRTASCTRLSSNALMPMGRVPKDHNHTVLQGIGWEVGRSAAREGIEKAADKRAAETPEERAAAEREAKKRAERAERKAAKARVKAKKQQEKAVDRELEALKRRLDD